MPTPTGKWSAPLWLRVRELERRAAEQAGEAEAQRKVMRWLVAKVLALEESARRRERAEAATELRLRVDGEPPT